MTASDASRRSSRAARRADLLAAWLVGPVLLVLAGVMYDQRQDIDVPHVERVIVAKRDFTTEPMRSLPADPPVTIIAGFEKKCTECHRLFDSPEATPPWLTQHCEVTTDHGLSDQCLDCHDRDNRNLLVLSGGRTVPFAESSRLCAKCHGLTWRDWQRGVHGRTVDYWDTSRGPSRRLACIECHDPHAPAYQPMRPLPGPVTLRMGDPNRNGHVEAVEPHNPLRHWRGQVLDGGEAEP